MNKFVIITLCLIIFNFQNTYSFVLKNTTTKIYKYVITTSFNNNNSIKKIAEGNIQPKSQDVIEIKITYPNVLFTLNDTYIATMGMIELKNEHHFQIMQDYGKSPFIVLEKEPPYANIIFQSSPKKSHETDESDIFTANILPKKDNNINFNTKIATDLLTKMLKNYNENEITNLEEIIKKLLKNPDILKKVKEVTNLIEEEIKNNPNSSEKEEKCNYRSTGVFGKLVDSVLNFKTFVVAAIIYLFYKTNPEILYQILGPPDGPRPS